MFLCSVPAFVSVTTTACLHIAPRPQLRIAVVQAEEYAVTILVDGGAFAQPALPRPRFDISSDVFAQSRANELEAALKPVTPVVGELTLMRFF